MYYILQQMRVSSETRSALWLEEQTKITETMGDVIGAADST